MTRQKIDWDERWLKLCLLTGRVYTHMREGTTASWPGQSLLDDLLRTDGGYTSMTIDSAMAQFLAEVCPELPPPRARQRDAPPGYMHAKRQLHKAAKRLRHVKN